MQVFKADRKIYLTNELLSWLWGFFSLFLLYFGFKQFSHINNDDLIPIAIGVMILKLGDTLTQYHVTEIQVDRQRNLLVLILYSALSGEKVKDYQLEQVSSELKENSGLKKFLFYSVLLKIFIAPKGTFRINSRYGFSSETLLAIADNLKLQSNPIVTQ